MMSSQTIFIQSATFDEDIARIQPEIDACLDPYDSSTTKLCIGQYTVDDQYYRCRVLDWNEELNEAKCVFIDFGNTEIVSLDTITKMSRTLRKVKPLALYCMLNEQFDVGSSEFEQLVELVNSETRFDVRVRTDELNSFYAAVNYDYGPIMVDLCTSGTNIMVNKVTLGDKGLWTSLLNNSPVTPVENVMAKDASEITDDWEKIKNGN